MSQKPATHCRDCGISLNESNWVHCGGRQKNLCRTCYNEMQKLWNANNKESKSRSSRQHKIVSRYGLTLEQFDEMVIAQGGVCAICHNPNNIVGRELTVDHCHLTNTIRGLLCHSCNLALGLVGDNIVVLYSMIEYIERHEPKANTQSLAIFKTRKEEVS